MGLSRNPCRFCVLAYEYNGRHIPSFTNVECQTCKNKEDHRAYLESKRMFTPEKPITTMEELLKQTWVIWHGSTKHIEMFRSMPVRTVEMFLNNGAFRKAIRKENDNA